MTSNANANSGRDKITGRDNSPTSPIERRTISSTYSSSNHRYSYASNETGESSTSASNRNSLAINTDKSAEDEDGRNGADISQLGVKDSRSNHRSHRKRQSGGFLLSSTTFDQHPHKPSTSEYLPRQREPSDDHKGKGKLPQPEKRHTKKRSTLGLGIGGSPLASNVTTVDTGNASGNRSTNGHNEEATSVPPTVEGDKTSDVKETPNTLDVDSAQIVNLALNLSESRRNAARRNVSVPLTPSTGFTEGFAGGSLRQHLQQQRKASRNISPKPDRHERASTASPRLLSGQKVNSPLQSAFESTQDSPYQYNFSASTLARAEKAKNAIELMAQYRRLLQYVPPLKPQALERPPTASPTGTASGSPTASTFSPVRTASTTNSARALGREYNPLQYIRNRKVRGRERKGIDGEAQGFGDLEKVSSWVDQLSRCSSSEDRQTADCLPLPIFSQAARDAASPHTSPQSSQGNGKPASVKIKRPRIDWVTNASDMIADVFWLEQDDNKKIIEDRHGRKIFPQDTELKRPVSHQSEKPEMPVSPGREDAGRDLRIDTKILPEFKSMKSDSEKSLDHAASRAKQRFREATRIHHGHNGSARESRLLSHSRSDSDSSESDSRLRRNQTRRKRSGTADSHDRGKDILEKQMMEMLAKEARDHDWGTTPDTEGQRIIQSIETQKPLLKDTGEPSGTVSGRHSRSASRVIYRRGHKKRDSMRNGSSGRPSLEVPGSNPRSSFEEFDSTAPSSPEARATKVANGFIPTIGMDLSPTHSRQASPTRNPLSRVRSKINMNILYDRTRDHSRGREGADEAPSTAASTKNSPAVVEGTDSPVTPERVKRSKSPVKKMISRRTDESSTSLKSRAGSLRGKSGEESSGIRGLFKSGRGAVAKVSDVLWKKDPSPGFGTSSGISSDDSDVEDPRNVPSKDGRGENIEEQPSSLPVETDDISPQKDRQSFLSSMPTFTSPFERRGRERLIPNSSDPNSTEEEYTLKRQQTREERRKLSMLEQPPRIDVQNASPTSSPDLQPPTRFRLDSDVSDIDSFRSGYSNGVHNADARLNAILGLPGKRRDRLPVTGLSQLETTHEKRPSIQGKRQWSISDRGISSERGPMTQREIARVRALLLSSGIKAKEIGRRSTERHDLRNPQQTSFSDIADLTKEPIPPVSKSQEHILAARILSTDIQLSTRMWQSSADNFSNSTMNGLLGRVEGLQSRIADNLTPMARKAADEADEVSKDLVTSQTLAVKRLTDMMDKMLRRRRRRFRWLRRGGWVLVEWALVGVMWWVWFIVVLARIIIGSFKGVVAFLRWLFWL